MTGYRGKRTVGKGTERRRTPAQVDAAALHSAVYFFYRALPDHVRELVDDMASAQGMTALQLCADVWLEKIASFVGEK